jgi:hypothetical protein
MAEGCRAMLAASGRRVFRHRIWFGYSGNAVPPGEDAVWIRVFRSSLGRRLSLKTFRHRSRPREAHLVHLRLGAVAGRLDAILSNAAREEANSVTFSTLSKSPTPSRRSASPWESRVDLPRRLRGAAVNAAVSVLVLAPVEEGPEVASAVLCRAELAGVLRSRGRPGVTASGIALALARAASASARPCSSGGPACARCPRRCRCARASAARARHAPARRGRDGGG